MSSFMDYVIVISVMVTLAVVRFGLPILCTWGICCLSRRISHHT